VGKRVLSGERTRAAVVRYVEALNAHDADAIAACVSEDFVNEHTSALGNACAGREEYRRRLPDFLGSFTGLRYDVEDVVTDGDRAVVAYTMRAIHEGHPIEIRGVMWIVVRDGLVARRTDYWDALTFLRQTGQA
jgi:steroid delta-isomerase-like uncharacterized protein